MLHGQFVQRFALVMMIACTPTAAQQPPLEAGQVAFDVDGKPAVTKPRSDEKHHGSIVTGRPNLKLVLLGTYEGGPLRSTLELEIDSSDAPTIGVRPIRIARYWMAHRDRGMPYGYGTGTLTITEVAPLSPKTARDFPEQVYANGGKQTYGRWSISGTFDAEIPFNPEFQNSNPPAPVHITRGRFAAIEVGETPPIRSY